MQIFDFNNKPAGYINETDGFKEVFINYYGLVAVYDKQLDTTTDLVNGGIKWGDQTMVIAYEKFKDL